MAAFRLDPERDPSDRQPGEPYDQYDWWLHWRNAGERRSYADVARRFGVKPARVRAVALRNRWSERLRLWKAANTRAVQASFAEAFERLLVPWAKGAERMIEIALDGDPESVSPDRALNAATNMIKLAKEPGIVDLAQSVESHSHAANSAPLETLMATLEQFPEAKQAVLDAWREQERREREVEADA